MRALTTEVDSERNPADVLMDPKSTKEEKEAVKARGVVDPAAIQPGSEANPADVAAAEADTKAKKADK